ncbi:MAG: serine hydrolase [Desulfobulbales bacterium]|nr:serine hydrolase [Desulfobulbales bacterium]
MSMEKKISGFIEENINNNVFPSISVGISSKKGKNKKRYIISSSKDINQSNKKELKKNIIFDLASLTKPFATVLSLLSLIKESKIRTGSQLRDIFKEEFNNDKKNISIEQLLSHSGGLPGHRDYHKKLVEVDNEHRKKLLLDLLIKEPLVARPGTQTLYSDLGYMLLGLVIEKVAGRELDDYFSKMIMAPIGLQENIFFNPVGSKKHLNRGFAPAEYCPWRGRVLAGEVSDENCWSLGGVAGHAGLYGDIEGVLSLSELILDIWQGKRDHPNINRRDLVRFLTRKSAREGDTWALGFDRPSPGRASCGKYLSPESVGHLGFTGTSFWLDPELELVIAILTNRVHPSRDNERIKKFRPEFHDRVVEWLAQ